MCADGEGFLVSDDWRDGTIRPLGSPWRRIRFANVDGLAVFEGCILLGTTADAEDARAHLESSIPGLPELLTRPGVQPEAAAIKGAQYRWKNRTIPFEIDPAFTDRSRIEAAIAHWHERTTIRFRPRTTERDYVFVRRVASGCASHVGRQGGRQEMILSDSCSVGNIIHEFGHTVGLWHEQSRADRDNVVEIVFTNIDPARTANFEQHVEDGIDVGQYDLGSIMHYPPNAFGIGGAQTIKLRDPLPTNVIPGTMGQRLAMSDGDIRAVEEIYATESMPNER